MDVAGLLAIAIGVLGVAGVIFTALRYNRDDTTAIVNQQDTIVSEMRSLNEELRITVDRLRMERDELNKTVEALRMELHGG